MASHNTVEKTVYVYDLDGNYIRHHEYLDYATAAAIKESINPKYDFIKYKAMIYNCLRGIMLRVGNRRFSWIPHSTFPLPSEIIYINNVKHFKYEVFKPIVFQVKSICYIGSLWDISIDKWSTSARVRQDQI